MLQTCCGLATGKLVKWILALTENRPVFGGCFISATTHRYEELMKVDRQVTCITVRTLAEASQAPDTNDRPSGDSDKLMTSPV